ncbi:MAG: methionyl-tRNA formyltransferase [Magnetospirillum sp.]|nr:methionyl-tRNA formyltransferase [Magnetospirillum sp.]
MRLVFMGTPDFSVPILAVLLDAGHQVAAVYSQPPRPAGRGHREQPSPVHAFAAARGLGVRTPKSLKGIDDQAAFAGLDADAAVVAAYGLILPKAILAAPRLGCLNVHASLLPRWRGAAPIQRAILAGDTETGVTIMQMDEGLDTGAMLASDTIPITGATTAAALHDALSAMGARMIVAALASLPRSGTPQPALGVTYAAKLAKDEGRIDWTRPAALLERMVRALNPWPGVWCELAGERLKVLAASVEPGQGEPGRLLDDRLLVACGEGALRLTRVQRAGKAPMTADELLRGFAVAKGTVLP